PPDDRPGDRGPRRAGGHRRRRAGRGRHRRDVAPQASLTHSPPMERTLILVKPDAFARGLTGEIVARFERKGLRIVAAQHMTMTEELASRHYAEHEGKPFYGELVSFITS